MGTISNGHRRLQLFSATGRLQSHGESATRCTMRQAPYQWISKVRGEDATSCFKGTLVAIALGGGYLLTDPVGRYLECWWRWNSRLMQMLMGIEGDANTDLEADSTGGQT